MDIFALGKTATFTANKIIESKSNFSGDMITDSESRIATQNSFRLIDAVMFFLGIIVGLYAAYLSWMCNGKVGYPVFIKAVFAVFAYLFGLIYLILYLIMKWDVCYVLKPIK
jgi:hypothetical protein